MVMDTSRKASRRSRLIALAAILGLVLTGALVAQDEEAEEYRRPSGGRSRSPRLRLLSVEAPPIAYIQKNRGDGHGYV